MQNWKKLGCISNVEPYTAVPVSFKLSNNLWRIIFSSRDSENRSIPYYLDLDLDKLQVSKAQRIDVPLGDLGMFDEQGIMPTCIVEIDKVLYLYYIGWNLGKSVPFRNALGLLMSKDQGDSFEKAFEGPIMDRSRFDKCFVASSYVFAEEKFYRMYYLSCNKWSTDLKGNLKHHYNIKYAESSDGVSWNREGKIAIDFRYENEYAISCPRVLKEDNIYKMWYSFRGGPLGNTYRIGYAESANAVDWVRKDELVQLDVSKDGWDKDMVCYPFIFFHNNNTYMLYNGNGYGKSGVGLAVLS